MKVEVDQEFIDAVAAAVLRLNGNTANQPVADSQEVQPDPWATMPNTSPVPPVQPSQPPQAVQPVAPVAPVPQPSAPVSLPPVAAGVYTISAPSGPQSWTVGAPNAPACKHGNPAAYVTGSKKGGGQFNAWRCAYSIGDVAKLVNGAPVDWHQKCAYNAWA